MKFKNWMPEWLAGIAFGVLWILGSGIEKLLMAFSAGITGLYLGTFPQYREGAWWFYGSELSVRVSSACSGMTFCMVLSSLWIWLLFTERPQFRRVRGILGILVLSVPLSAGVNAARILLSAEVYHFALPHLSDEWLTRLHLQMGVLTFLPALLLIFVTARWRLRHASIV
ncbi:exosortase/archaeosortase family protein [Kiritimatiellaeota bacterium B1221]|nr:exosortase/archaeosortase family protein [Kiritimatiellaeota bacterium B1221]